MRPIASWKLPVAVVPEAKPELLGSTFSNVPRAPLADTYTPLPGDSTNPPTFFLLPARQPTAATTAPPAAFVTPPGAWTATSVTMLARKQVVVVVSPAHEPVGSSTF